MRNLTRVVSWIALASVIVPSFLYLAGRMDLPRVKWIMLIATLVWFATVPLWMGRKPTESGGQ